MPAARTNGNGEGRLNLWLTILSLAVPALVAYQELSMKPLHLKIDFQEKRLEMLETNNKELRNELRVLERTVRGTPLSDFFQMWEDAKNNDKGE